MSKSMYGILCRLNISMSIIHQYRLENVQRLGGLWKSRRQQYIQIQTKK
jgi:hypothetical protein